MCRMVLFTLSVVAEPFHRLRVVVREEQTVPQIQLTDGLHVLVAQREIEDLEVLLRSLRTDFGMTMTPR